MCAYDIPLQEPQEVPLQEPQEVPLQGPQEVPLQEPQEVPLQEPTTVINVKMQSLRKLYGNKYANQLEWERGSDSHVSIGRANSVRVKTDDTYEHGPK